MLFSSLLSLLSLTTFFAHTAAKSILEANTTSPQYYLRTCVLDNGSPSKNGLYVSSYHTGAGINDVVLTTKANAVTGFMNATHQQFNLGGTLATPWAFVVAGSDPYAEWQPMEINVGYGEPGWFLNATGLQWNSTEFNGWIACDWWHNEPQLFWKFYKFAFPLPSSCAHVDLIAENL